MTYQSARANRLIRMFRDGLPEASYETKVGSPNKRLEAMHYIDFLTKLREAKST